MAGFQPLWDIRRRIYNLPLNLPNGDRVFKQLPFEHPRVARLGDGRDNGLGRTGYDH